MKETLTLEINKKVAWFLWHVFNNSKEFADGSYIKRTGYTELDFLKTANEIHNKDISGNKLWGEINNFLLDNDIDPETKFDDKPKIKIAGYVVEFKENTVKVGCTEVKISEIEKLVAELKNLGKIK